MNINKAMDVPQAYDDACWFASFSSEGCYREAVDTARELGVLRLPIVTRAIAQNRLRQHALLNLTMHQAYKLRTAACLKYCQMNHIEPERNYNVHHIEYRLGSVN